MIKISPTKIRKFFTSEGVYFGITFVKKGLHFRKYMKYSRFSLKCRKFEVAHAKSSCKCRKIRGWCRKVSYKN